MKNITRIQLGKKYKADNGNIGVFNGKWTVGVWGIEYSLEDSEGNIIGTIRQKNVGGRLIEEE